MTWPPLNSKALSLHLSSGTSELYLTHKQTVKQPKGSCFIHHNIFSSQYPAQNSASINTPMFTNCTNSQCWDAVIQSLSSASLIQVGTWTQFQSRSQSLFLTEKLNLKHWIFTVNNIASHSQSVAPIPAAPVSPGNLLKASFQVSSVLFNQNSLGGRPSTLWLTCLQSDTDALNFENHWTRLK